MELMNHKFIIYMLSAIIFSVGFIISITPIISYVVDFDLIFSSSTNMIGIGMMLLGGSGVYYMLVTSNEL